MGDRVHQGKGGNAFNQRIPRRVQKLIATVELGTLGIPVPGAQPDLLIQYRCPMDHAVQPGEDKNHAMAVEFLPGQPALSQMQLAHLLLQLELVGGAQPPILPRIIGGYFKPPGIVPGHCISHGETSFLVKTLVTTKGRGQRLAA